MPIPPLTPAQQAALDQFESDAAAATKAAADNLQAQNDLIVAQRTAETDAQNAIDTHVTALASAQAFIDSMLNPLPTPATATPTPVKK